MSRLDSLRKPIFSAATALLYLATSAAPARAYSFNYVVADMRLSAAASGGSACPIPAHFSSATAGIPRRWSTALGTSPVTVLTADQTPDGRLNEIESAILESFAVWTGVSGSSLKPASLAPLARSAAQSACAADGTNTICFGQADGAFTPGVLAFTRLITADHAGAQLGSGPAAVEAGQILDADIYFNPNDPRTTFATPAALSSQASAYDLESILTHELGHFFGFSHSAVWRAMMYPFAPAPGTFVGTRPTAQQPDAPLSDDDRTGLRALYPDPADTLNTGSMRGRILPANPLSLPAAPPGVTGLYGTHVVALDAATGSVVAAVLGGWSCSAPGPAQFDGSFRLDHLPLGRSYKLYAEPLSGAVDPSQVSSATATVCRNAISDPGWPAPFSCIVPLVTTDFSARLRPAP